MSDDPSLPETVSTTQAEAQAAATRRRWITFGEVLAVAAVAISALTLWNNWSERRDTEAVKSADAQRASTKAATLVLMSTGAGDRALELKPADAGQTVQSQKIVFPTALGAAPAETTGEPRIEARWFESALLKARERANLPDNSRGDERLPVAITTRFLVDGQPHEDVALYDIGYTVSGKLLSGHDVKLRGLSLVKRVKGAAQTGLDARWKALLPDGR